MSRKGNLGQRPMESYFGSMKTDLFTRSDIQHAMLPSETCSPTSKDTTIVSGSIPSLGASPPNRQSANPPNPVST